jgi:hypothetical protein
MQTFREWLAEKELNEAKDQDIIKLDNMGDFIIDSSRGAEHYNTKLQIYKKVFGKTKVEEGHWFKIIRYKGSDGKFRKEDCVIRDWLDEDAVIVNSKERSIRPTLYVRNKGAYENGEFPQKYKEFEFPRK